MPDGLRPDAEGFIKSPEELAKDQAKLKAAKDAIRDFDPPADLGGPLRTDTPESLPALPLYTGQPPDERGFTPLPGLKIVLSQGASADAASAGPSPWQFGPLMVMRGDGWGCSAVGCALVVTVVLALIASFAFHLGPFVSHNTPSVAGAVETSPSSAATGHCAGDATVIVDLFFPDLAQSGGATPPSFDTRTLGGGGKKYCLTHLATYHWADGKGTPHAGTLTLLDSHNRKVGEWQAVTTPATNDVPANWEANIPTSPPVILDGVYTVTDSGTDTWSWSKQSGGKGFVRVWAQEYVP